LNATCGQSGQPRFGFTSSDVVTDLELPLPNIRLFDRCRDTVIDAFVNHEITPSEVVEKQYFASVFNPGNYGGALQSAAATRMRRRYGTAGLFRSIPEMMRSGDPAAFTRQASLQTIGSWYAK
jgi:hypothetical protein